MSYSPKKRRNLILVAKTSKIGIRTLGDGCSDQGPQRSVAGIPGRPLGRHSPAPPEKTIPPRALTTYYLPVTRILFWLFTSVGTPLPGTTSRTRPILTPVFVVGYTTGLDHLCITAGSRILVIASTLYLPNLGVDFPEIVWLGYAPAGPAKTKLPTATQLLKVDGSNDEAL
ncbi:hypothetical protein LZ30DRAFT_772545 [Colletotrichum cereale]|nr:hypothetical protein LZ30DRAFT_772545 [Colletotrichum cereale]